MSFPESGISVVSALSAQISGEATPRPSSFFCVTALLAFAWTANAQSPAQASTSRGGVARIAAAAIVSQKPVIDGRLDDPAWKTVAPLTGFIQRELREGDPVTERTEVRVISDGEALYVGAWLWDREPQGIVPGEKIRDVAL